MDDRVYPIRAGSRGFVTHDGEVFGWSLFSGDHNTYLRKHGKTDKDFAARWRQWGGMGDRIDFEDWPDRDTRKKWDNAVNLWIVQNADAEIEMP